MSIIKNIYDGVENEIVRSLSLELFNMFRPTGLTVSIESTDGNAKHFSSIVRSFSPIKYDKYSRLLDKDDVITLEIGTLYYITVANKTYARISYLKEDDGKNSHKILRFTVYGENKHKVIRYIHHKFEKAVGASTKVRCQTEDFTVRNSLKPRNFETIVLPSVDKEYLIANLNKWRNMKQWYNDHSIIYKKGILLYGEPGAGKSSIIRAISEMFGKCNIVISNSSKPGDILDNHNIHVGNSIMTVFVFEDIDILFMNRSGISDEKSSALNTVLQILDGPLSKSNTIYIATTNKRELLDPALTRPGRFDLQLEVKYFDEELALEFVEKFGFGKNFLDSLNLDYPVQPAFLQSKIMEKVNIDF